MTISRHTARYSKFKSAKSYAKKNEQMVLAWRAMPNGRSNQFSRKLKVKGSKRASRYECPLIRTAYWIFFRSRVFTGY